MLPFNGPREGCQLKEIAPCRLSTRSRGADLRLVRRDRDFKAATKSEEDPWAVTFVRPCRRPDPTSTYVE